MSDPKRIIIFATAYFPLVGGAEVAMKEMTDRLTDWSFDLVCARIRPGLASTEKIGNVTVHRVGFGSPIDKYLLPFLGPIKAMRLAKQNDVSFIWALMASYGGFAALVYCWLRPRTRLLLNLQEGDPLEHYAKRVGRIGFLHRAIFRRADAIQAISHFLADWSVRMGARAKPEVIPNGVDVERFAVKISEDRRRAIRTAWNISENETALITTSRLSLKNGVDDLIRSLSHLPSSVKAVIVGEGEDREKLTALVQELHVGDRVIFSGLQPNEKLPELLHAADIFVRPALSEGLGISYLEAMAAGLPIIATPVGGIPDFLKDGETGVFCQARDPASVAAAVKRIQSELGLRAKLIANGARLMREQYDWDVITKRIEKKFIGLSQETPRSRLGIGFWIVALITVAMSVVLGWRAINLRGLANASIRNWSTEALQYYRTKTGLGLSSFDIKHDAALLVEPTQYSMVAHFAYRGPASFMSSHRIKFDYAGYTFVYEDDEKQYVY